MATVHCVGFPRMGAKRELKFALERYWSGKIDAEQLRETARAVRAEAWRTQRQIGIEVVASGDSSYYDPVLDMSVALGNVPARFHTTDSKLDRMFLMARGRAPSGTPVAACEMTKWFNTNYHYIVPELSRDGGWEPGAVNASHLVEQIEQAAGEGHSSKPLAVGPCTYLWLSKVAGEPFDKLSLLDKVVDCYSELLRQVAASGAKWIQLDEPLTALDLPPEWRDALARAYQRLNRSGLKVMVGSYFAELGDNADALLKLNVDGYHLDAINNPASALERFARQLRPQQVLSLGAVDGRNVWAADLERALGLLKPLHDALGARLWLSTSCSLQFVPYDLEMERALDPELKGWLAFAKQKLEELAVLNGALEGDADAQQRVAQRGELLAARRASKRVNNPAVREAVEAVTPAMLRRETPHRQRYALQREALGLPNHPTTTVGSFPQTPDIRACRRAFRNNAIDANQYRERIRGEIKQAIRKQQDYGLDVLVHGEAERNDMVEYFGEQLEGYAATEHGWVLSFGSRCVKPPIIYGDVRLTQPMTVDWITYAQSLTEQPVKGMRPNRPHF